MTVYLTSIDSTTHQPTHQPMFHPAQRPIQSSSYFGAADDGTQGRANPLKPFMLIPLLCLASLLLNFTLFNRTLWAFPSSPGQEKAEINENATLTDYLVYAALNNPGLKAAFFQWKAALEKIPRVRALPDPRFTFVYFVREVETRVGPQRQKIGIMQRFPWFGKLKLKGNVAAEAANARQKIYEGEKSKLFYRVKKTYYEYYYLARAIGVLKENLQLLEYLEGVVRVKYQTGTASHADLLKVQVETDILRDRLNSMEDGVGPLTTQLNAALNRPLHLPLPLPKTFSKDRPSLSPEAVERGGNLLQWEPLAVALKQFNPNLAAVDALAAKENVGVQLAKRQFYPDVSLGVDYILTGKTKMPDVADSGKDPLMVMVSLNIPIGFKKLYAGVREAENRLNAVNAARMEKKNQLLARLRQVFYKYGDTKRRMCLYSDALIPKARQGLEVTQSAFEAGKADFLNLIDSQRTLLSFQLDYQRAFASHLQYLAELEMLVGKELSPSNAVKMVPENNAGNEPKEVKNND